MAGVSICCPEWLYVYEYFVCSIHQTMEVSQMNYNHYKNAIEWKKTTLIPQGGNLCYDKCVNACKQ